jgi:4-hydroxy-tetrahydrodipicolinate synthase
MISPLTAAFVVDVAAVDRVVDHILAGGCSGLFVLGSLGEGAWLDTAQRSAMVRSTVESAHGRAPVIVGVMLPATAPAREAALRAADAGADALAVGSPYYFDPGAADQQRHTEAILAATPLPVLLYNIPQVTRGPLATETLTNLLMEPRVLGIKDSWGNLPYFQQLLDLKRTRPDFRVLQGIDHVAMASLLLGGDGLMCALGNIVPRLFADLVAASRTGNSAECQRIHARIIDLTRIYARGAEVRSLYAAAARLGLCENVPAEPWHPVEGDILETIDLTLRAHNLLAAESVV